MDHLQTSMLPSEQNLADFVNMDIPVQSFNFPSRFTAAGNRNNILKRGTSVPYEFQAPANKRRRQTMPCSTSLYDTYGNADLDYTGIMPLTTRRSIGGFEETIPASDHVDLTADHVDMHTSLPLLDYPAMIHDDPLMMSSEWENVQNCVENATAGVVDLFLSNEYNDGELDAVLFDEYNVSDSDNDIFLPNYGMDIPHTDEAAKLMMELAIMSKQNEVHRRNIEQMRDLMKMQRRRCQQQQQQQQQQRWNQVGTESEQLLTMMLMREQWNPMSCRSNVAARRMSCSERAIKSRVENAMYFPEQPSPVDPTKPTIPIGTMITFPAVKNCCTSNCINDDDVSILTIPTELLMNGVKSNNRCVFSSSAA